MNLLLRSPRRGGGAPGPGVSVVSVVSLLCGLLACTGLLGGDGHLRGTVEPSPDGRTYLQFDDDNGGEACRRIHVDGEPWPHPLGVPAEIEPGVHTAECAGALEFEVPEGVIFRFDDWGP